MPWTKVVLQDLESKKHFLTSFTLMAQLQSISEILLIAWFVILQYFFQWNIAFAILFHYCRYLLRNISILFQYYIEILQFFLCNILKIFFWNFWWICLKFNVITSRFNFYAASKNTTTIFLKLIMQLAMPNY